MENYLSLLLGTIFSCVIISAIMFQYINESYERAYRSKLLYTVIQIGVISIMVLINLLNIPLLNFLSWIILFGVIVASVYFDYGKGALQRIFEVTVLMLIITISETVGYILLEFIFWKLDIKDIQPGMLQCLKITFSKLTILVLYYLVVIRIWKSGKQNKFTVAQYVVYSVIIIYSILNLSVIVIVVSNEIVISTAENILLLINMFGIVAITMFFLYFTKYSEENGQLKLKLKLLEQQSDLQYKYYHNQEEKYNESIKILHDVNKHLKMVEEIYQVGGIKDAKAYTEEISRMLKPLVPHEYSNNPILNILINDKEKCASLHNINFELEIGNVDLKFMEQIEVTTLFGNLLDNAIEACETVIKNRFINMKLDSYNDFVVIHISNSTNQNIKWVDEKPISTKGKNHGIGLMNIESVIKKYNGNMILEERQGIFSCNIILNG